MLPWHSEQTDAPVYYTTYYVHNTSANILLRILLRHGRQVASMKTHTGIDLNTAPRMKERRHPWQGAFFPPGILNVGYC